MHIHFNLTAEQADAFRAALCLDDAGGVVLPNPTTDVAIQETP